MDAFDDRKLLAYDTYEEYLDSFIVTDDIFYLRNRDFARTNAALGYRTSTAILTRQAFLTQREAVYESIFPSRKPHILYSAHYHKNDEFLQELSLRERSNRVGMMTTIISMRHRKPNGEEISGFIDFAESLTKCMESVEDARIDWYAVFNYSKRVWPTKHDLGYFNWSTGYSCMNDSKHFKAITDPHLGLIFESRNDRHRILMDPLAECSRGTTRTKIDTPNYAYVVLFDHVVRNRP
ncbi:cilia- and flagella-associated protein 299-like [Bradysia coprophila]|uniref:cilia- and flagella-associated protein 299-like n=1 Tax=Bradysia coprophila TaxID=38358 RepID=UPI00187DC5C7|nr:cilia- and flagella-associated protein 299-like [Bradysia coprophila]